MVTNNFKAIVKGALIYSDSNTGLIPVTRQDGSHYYYIPGSDTIRSDSITTYNNTAGFYIGSGTNPPAATDYCLQSRITSGFSASTTKSFVDDNGTPTLQVIMTITNTSASDLTIAEIGHFRIMKATPTQYSGSSSRNDAYMTERNVLATPIVLAPNDYTTIKYTAETIEEVTP